MHFHGPGGISVALLEGLLVLLHLEGVFGAALGRAVVVEDGVELVVDVEELVAEELDRKGLLEAFDDLRKRLVLLNVVGGFTKGMGPKPEGSGV